MTDPMNEKEIKLVSDEIARWVDPFGEKGETYRDLAIIILGHLADSRLNETETPSDEVTKTLETAVTALEQAVRSLRSEVEISKSLREEVAALKNSMNGINEIVRKAMKNRIGNGTKLYSGPRPTDEDNLTERKGNDQPTDS